MEGCKKSIINYGACSQEFMNWNVTMKIYDKGELSFTSDHSPILIWWKDTERQDSSGTKNNLASNSYWKTSNDSNNEKFKHFVEYEVSTTETEGDTVEEFLEFLVSTLKNGADTFLKTS